MNINKMYGFTVPENVDVFIGTTRSPSLKVRYDFLKVRSKAKPYFFQNRAVALHLNKTAKKNADFCRHFSLFIFTPEALEHFVVFIENRFLLFVERHVSALLHDHQ